jgi:hypothetical protein
MHDVNSFYTNKEKSSSICVAGSFFLTHDVFHISLSGISSEHVDQNVLH